MTQDNTNLSSSVDGIVNINPAHGGCTCECHNHPPGEIIHCVPCCYPTDDTPPTPIGEKINITKEMRSQTFASRIVLSGITYAADKSLIKRLAVANHDDEGLTIAITANGNELNFLEFAKRLEASIDKEILEKAKEIAAESVVGKFDDITELMNDLDHRLRNEINDRLDVWEDPV